MSVETGIVGFGGYLPRMRLDRAAILEAIGWANPALRALGRGERALASWDEDSVTMAVEAARGALTGRAHALRGLSYASTTAPFSDRSNAGLIAGALDLDENLVTQDVGGSQRAATTALATALRRPPSEDGEILLVAAEKRSARPASTQEMLYGDGAAALVLGREAPIARLIGFHSVAADLVDHYRLAGERFDYALEERWIRDEGFFRLIPAAVTALLERTGVSGGEIDRILLPAPKRVAAKIAARLGIKEGAVADSLDGSCGHTGTAHPLLMLVHALEQGAPGERVLVIGFGQGADALLLEFTPALADYVPGPTIVGALAGGKSETRYVRYLSFEGLLSVDFGMRAERDDRTSMTAFYRNRRAITGFVGGRCESCGTTQFPRSGVCINPDCRRADTQRDYGLADCPAKVKSYTEDWLAYTPSPPLMYGNVQFEGGANVLMEFTDFGPGELSVGLPVRMMFRIKDIDRKRAFKRYFWKPAPIAARRETK